MATMRPALPLPESSEVGKLVSEVVVASVVGVPLVASVPERGAVPMEVGMASGARVPSAMGAAVPATVGANSMTGRPLSSRQRL